MIFITTDGLSKVAPYHNGNVPIYLTDNHEAIDGPTYWAASICIKKSKSRETLKQYSSTIARFLQWLDDNKYGAENWQHVDREIILLYCSHIQQTIKAYNKDSESNTIDYYLARLQAFYLWAKINNYSHYWDLNIDVILIRLKDEQNSLGRINNNPIKVEKLDIKTSNASRRVDDLQKFVTKKNFLNSCTLFDDFVYVVIANIVWITALRPKEFLQIPYHGKGLNSGFKNYDDRELIDIGNINFYFESKGKPRNIDFPGYLWAWICKTWLPIRAERALLYRKKHNVGLPNDALFVSKNGNIVSYHMVNTAFKNVKTNKNYEGGNFGPTALRHSFATYFVYLALKNESLIGKPYLYNAIIDDALRKILGHNDIETTYKFYVHIVNRFALGGDDLIYEISKKENMKILQYFVDYVPFNALIPIE